MRVQVTASHAMRTTQQTPRVTRLAIPDVAAIAIMMVLQRVVNYWLLHRGFSIGIGDSEAPAIIMRQVRVVVWWSHQHPFPPIRFCDDNWSSPSS